MGVGGLCGRFSTGLNESPELIAQESLPTWMMRTTRSCLNESPELIAQESRRRLGLECQGRRLNESPELIAQEFGVGFQSPPILRASMKVLSLLLRNDQS